MRGHPGDRGRPDPLPRPRLHRRRVQPGRVRPSGSTRCWPTRPPTPPTWTPAARYAYLFFFRNPVASPGVEEHVLGLARLTIDRPRRPGARGQSGGRRDLRSGARTGAPADGDQVTGPLLVLRAESGRGIGAGHVARALALGQAWRDLGGAGGAGGRRGRRPVAHRGPATPGWRVVGARPATEPGAGRAGWAVLDGYGFTLADQRRWRAVGGRLLVVDDHGAGRHWDADLVLDQNLGADRSPTARGSTARPCCSGRATPCCAASSVPPARRPESGATGGPTRCGPGGAGRGRQPGTDGEPPGSTGWRPGWATPGSR